MKTMGVQTTLIFLWLCPLLCQGASASFDYNATPRPLASYLPMKPVTDFRKYLQHYNYLGPDSHDPRTSNLRDGSAERQALIKFQRTAGIRQTGVADEATMRMMAAPRCGVKDGDSSKRLKRFAHEGSKWDNAALTYRINSFTEDLPRGTISDIISKAFKTWSAVTPLTFTKRNSGNVDIDLDFYRRAHGDQNPFDGPGKVLAHAFFPRFGGDIHFDDDEFFTNDQAKGINLFQTAVHELGHSLGLSHSEDPDALMAPLYRGYVPNFKLHSDDILAIQRVYGKKPDPTTPAPTTTTSTTPRSDPSGGGKRTTIVPTTPPTTTPTMPAGACRGHFDAITAGNTRYSSPVIFAFSGENYYLISRGKVNPRDIKQDFKRFDRVDAAFAVSRTASISLYLFSMQKIYIYTIYYRSRSISIRYDGEREIRSAIHGLPSYIDAFFTWSGNLFAIKGKKYYRIARGAVIKDYPRNITKWNLPENVKKVDAAFQYGNGKLFFFSGTDYYKYDDEKLTVAKGYPRNVGENWLKCELGTSTQSPANLLMEDKVADDGFVRVKTALQLESAASRTALPAFSVTVLLLVCLSISHIFL